MTHEGLAIDLQSMRRSSWIIQMVALRLAVINAHQVLSTLHLSNINFKLI